MYWFDTTLLLLLALGALLGAWSGLIGQVARFICLGISIYAAVLFHEPGAHILHERVLQGSSLQVSRVVSGIGIFVAVYLAGHLTSRLARSGMRAADLESFDRLLGALLGSVKMALLLGAICLGVANHKHPATEVIVSRSSLVPVFADGMEWIVVQIPEEYKSYLRESVEHLRERMGQVPV
jgi:membrane protein required for colicin V production